MPAQHRNLCQRDSTVKLQVSGASARSMTIFVPQEAAANTLMLPGNPFLLELRKIIKSHFAKYPMDRVRAKRSRHPDGHGTCVKKITGLLRRSQWTGDLGTRLANSTSKPLRSACTRKPLRSRAPQGKAAKTAMEARLADHTQRPKLDTGKVTSFQPSTPMLPCFVGPPQDPKALGVLLPLAANGTHSAMRKALVTSRLLLLIYGLDQVLWRKEERTHATAS